MASPDHNRVTNLVAVADFAIATFFFLLITGNCLQGAAKVLKRKISNDTRILRSCQEIRKS